MDVVEQLASPQLTVAAACWQAPASQTPVFPQGAAAEAAQRLCGSAWPFATVPQVPPTPRAQDWQVPQLETVQQTPSTQLFVPHSWPVLQVAPLARFARHCRPAPGQ